LNKINFLIRGPDYKYPYTITPDSLKKHWQLVTEESHHLHNLTTNVTIYGFGERFYDGVQSLGRYQANVVIGGDEPEYDGQRTFSPWCRTHSWT